MKIIITGRHFDVSEDLSQYAEKKLSKLKKYFHNLIDINVIMYIEKHHHIIETVINGDGMRFHGTEKANDMYSSVDLLIKSMEKQVVKHKKKHSGHKVVPLTKSIQSGSIPEDRFEVLLNQVGKKPKDEVEAFLEMRIDNKDFILFKKNNEQEDNNDIDNYAVIYKSGKGFKMAKVLKDMIKGKRFGHKRLMEFDLIVNDDSLTNPKIKITKCNKKTIRSMAMNNAVKEIMTCALDFVPFYNNETNYLNIIYKNGESIEVMVPPK